MKFEIGFFIIFCFSKSFKGTEGCYFGRFYSEGSFIYDFLEVLVR